MIEEPAGERRRGKCVVQGRFGITSILPVKINISQGKISSQSDVLAVICLTGSQKNKTKHKERAYVLVCLVIF